MVIMHVFKNLKENMASENSPRGFDAKKNIYIYIYICLGQGRYFWKDGLLIRGICEKLFFEGWIQVEIGWKICGF